MLKTIALCALALALAACSKPLRNEVQHLELQAEPTACEPEIDLAVGCFEPDALCCDLAEDIDARCAAALSGSTPFVCAEALGAETRDCIVVDAPTHCAWGASEIACCRPLTEE